MVHDWLSFCCGDETLSLLKGSLQPVRVQDDLYGRRQVERMIRLATSRNTCSATVYSMVPALVVELERSWFRPVLV